MKKKIIYLFVFCILFPNLWHAHFIAHYHNFLKHEETLNCGIEGYYIIPYLVFVFFFSIYKIYKNGFFLFLKLYKVHIIFVVLGLFLVFLLGQHPYMDYYID